MMKIKRNLIIAIKRFYIVFAIIVWAALFTEKSVDEIKTLGQDIESYGAYQFAKMESGGSSGWMGYYSMYTYDNCLPTKDNQRYCVLFRDLPVPREVSMSRLYIGLVVAFYFGGFFLVIFGIEKLVVWILSPWVRIED